MNLIKLTEDLQKIKSSAYGYHIGGQTMGIPTNEFEQIISDAIKGLELLRNADEALRILYGDVNNYVDGVIQRYLTAKEKFDNEDRET